MALNNEDKADVRRHYGKAIANKVAKATRDYEIRGDKNKPSYGYPRGSAAAAAARDNDADRGRAKNARKELFKSGVKNVGKDKAIELSKKAFGSRETRAQMSDARKAYNNARAADSLPKKRGAFGIK